MVRGVLAGQPGGVLLRTWVVADIKKIVGLILCLVRENMRVLGSAGGVGCEDCHVEFFLFCLRLCVSW